jgi:hypothetical protein
MNWLSNHFTYFCFRDIYFFNSVSIEIFGVFEILTIGDFWQPAMFKSYNLLQSHYFGWNQQKNTSFLIAYSLAELILEWLFCNCIQENCDAQYSKWFRYLLWIIRNNWPFWNFHLGCLETNRNAGWNFPFESTLVRNNSYWLVFDRLLWKNAPFPRLLTCRWNLAVSYHGSPKVLILGLAIACLPLIGIPPQGFGVQ